MSDTLNNLTAEEREVIENAERIKQKAEERAKEERRNAQRRESYDHWVKSMQAENEANLKMIRALQEADKDGVLTYEYTEIDRSWPGMSLKETAKFPKVSVTSAVIKAPVQHMYVSVVSETTGYRSYSSSARTTYKYELMLPSSLSSRRTKYRNPKALLLRVKESISILKAKQKRKQNEQEMLQAGLEVARVLYPKANVVLDSESVNTGYSNRYRMQFTTVHYVLVEVKGIATVKFSVKLGKDDDVELVPHAFILSQQERERILQRMKEQE